jgi:Plasmid pRiA4b ORF-3-like protein
MKDLIVRISITLLDVDPAIWRRIEAPANVTLEGLHDVIQVVMGWADYHFHHFQIGSVRYSARTHDDVDMQDGRKLKLSTLIVEGERAFAMFTTTATTGTAWSCSKQPPR